MKTHPLTETLRGMFLEWDADRASTRYSIVTVHEFPRGLDVARLVRAVEAAAAAEEMFAIRLVEEDGEVRWTAEGVPPVAVERRTADEAGAAAFERALPRPFDAFTGPFARFTVIETPASVRLVSEIFHLALDGTSQRAFIGSIAAHYDGTALPPPEVSFADYAEGERARLDSEAYRAAKAAAAARFAGREMTVPEAPAPGETAERCPWVRTRVDGRRINAFLRAHGLDANRFFMAAFARTLALYAGTDEAVFFTVNHGRRAAAGAPSLARTPGALVKTVPVLGVLKPDLPCADYVASFRLHGAGDYPFTHFCRDLGIRPGWGFVFQSGAVDMALTLDGLASAVRTPMSGGAGEMPVVQVYADGGDYRLTVTWEPGRYGRDFVMRFLSRLALIAGRLAAETTLGAVSVLTDAEFAGVLKTAWGGELEGDPAATFPSLFREQAARRPEAPAVTGPDGTLAYAELDARSDALAAALAARGVTAGDFVALRLPRDTRFAVALVAVQKLGAGYVPLDPAYPEERLAYMVADSGAKVTVDAAFLAACDPNRAIPASDRPAVLPSSPAYMIYTSGSTGRPKGVVVPQRALVNLIRWFARDCGVGPGKRNVSLASFSFDASVPDLMVPLATGGEVHILDEDTRRDLQAAGDYCVQHAITGGVASTQMGLALVNAYPDLPLEYLMLGGEKLTAFAKTPVRILNGYGPTEFCVCSSYHEVDQAKSYDIPIGRAVPNTYSFVVDRLGQPVPPGLTGEIALAGPQLADGYWHNPEKTAAAFVPIPFPLPPSPNQPTAAARLSTMYRTGDLGRYDGNGELVFQGRIDFQVKLRGFRIEIGEVEHAAASRAGVTGAVVLVKKIGGVDRLVLYYTGAGVEAAALKAHMAARLAPYMVPDRFVALAAMPLTPGGKIDRKALPEPGLEAAPVEPPATDAERDVLAAVKAVLRRDDIGVTHDFTDLGLTSLSAMELIVKLARALRVKVTMRQLQERPNVRALAELVPAVPAAAEPVRRRPRLKCYPMSENQRGILTDWLRNPDSTQYNIPAAIRFPKTGAEELAAAMAKVLAAHGAFAIRFEERDGQFVQVPGAEPAEVKVERLDCEPDAAFFAARVKPFAVTGAPLARISVFASPSAAYLFLDVHHAIFDGYSLGVALRDLERALRGGAIPAEERSSLDAALDERDYLESEDADEDDRWFERYLDGAEATRIEPSARVAGVRAGEAGRTRLALPRAEVAARCRALGVTESDFFLTALTELLHRLGRGENTLVSFVTAGRTDPALADSTGMFVKTLPVKGVTGETTFSAAARRMHADVRALLDHARASFARLSEKFGLRPEVMFVFEGGIFALPEGASVIPVDTDTAKVPIALTVTPGAEDYDIVFEYDRSVYPAADIDRLASMYASLVRGAVKTDGLRAIPLVADSEREALFALSYGGDLAYDRSQTFVTLFGGQVAARPGAVAAVDRERSLTYAELDALADALGAELVRRGVKAGEYVGVKLPRKVDFLVAVLAVEKLGAGYVPLDPAYPEERLAYMVSDSGARAVIDEDFLEGLGGLEGLKGTRAPAPRVPPVLPSSPAYMIYTSGSTGRPKGVAVPHRALLNLIHTYSRGMKMRPGNRHLHLASFSFDASVPGIMVPLATGGEVHVMDEDMRMNPLAIGEYCRARAITWAVLPTQLGLAILGANPDLPLEYMVVGGEKLTAFAKTRVRVVNGYGPTEFCVQSSCHLVDQSRQYDIPIGRPSVNTYSLVVDRYGQLLPAGQAGEIALAGVQLADGYWHNPEKTAAAFVPVPFDLPDPQPLMYLTGDRGRYNADGELEYLGRFDFQVKIRGFRIEFGEVENAAKTHPGIGAVAAEVREVGGAKHLVLYYEGHADEAALRAAMAARLAEYMVPDFFVAMEKLPLTPNGKINRRLLKAPEPAGGGERAYVAPAEGAETRIAAVFADVLKADRVGATDDFFDLGGTSIVAIMAVIALQKAGFDVQYGDFFKYKTPRALAAFLAHGAAGAAAAASAGAFDFGAYDYAAIGRLLAATPTDLFTDFARRPLGRVLLTGATGYLGMHVLRHLLEKTDSEVLALARPRRGVGGARRLDAQYVYYFGERLPKRFAERLAVVEADVTDGPAKLLAADPRLAGAETVINCAALVKHYVADDLMDRVNVKGVENLIALCERTGARLVHASTYSIGGSVRAESAAVLDERALYIGQESDNDYIRTKFLAERAILEAVAAGRVRGKVMRLGNLMGREADGEFQMNLGANAFVNSLRSYRALGVFPLEELARPLEMSPIDRVAEAICLLATTPDGMCVFHPYNRYALDMGAVIAAMNAAGYPIDAVSRADFAAHVDALRNDPAHAAELQGVLHYAGHLLEGRRAAPVDNAWTTTVLYRLGFRWKPAEENYLANFFKMLEGLAAFG